VNNYTTAKVVYGKAFIQKWMAALTAAVTTGLLAAAKIRLSKDPQFNPTPDSVLSALAAQEADFSGYPAGGKALILAQGVGSSAGAYSDLAQVLFTGAPATPQVVNTITGYWVDDATEFCIGERFTAGLTVPFESAADYFGLTLLVPLMLYQTP
jgi:hypothetical protein